MQTFTQKLHLISFLFYCLNILAFHFINCKSSFVFAHTHTQCNEKNVYHLLNGCLKKGLSTQVFHAKRIIWTKFDTYYLIIWHKTIVNSMERKRKGKKKNNPFMFDEMVVFIYFIERNICTCIVHMAWYDVVWRGVVWCGINKKGMSTY